MNRQPQDKVDKFILSFVLTLWFIVCLALAQSPIMWVQPIGTFISVLFFAVVASELVWRLNIPKETKAR